MAVPVLAIRVGNGGLPDGGKANGKRLPVLQG
jgi:hypothetical protein